jgi:GNAT superfamily N-acetyltransferase
VEKDFDSVFSLDDRADDWPWEQTEDGLGKNDANRQLKVESCVFPQRVWHLKTRDLDLVKDLEGNFWISAPNMTPPQLVEHLPFYAKDRSSARLGLELNLDLAHGQPDFSSWQDKGICLIHWLIKPNMPGELKDWIKVLRQVSKLGIWNHLVLPPGNALSGLADFCTANPNMGHSWQRLDAPLNPEDYASYGRAKSLPGNPFWLSLSRPDHMLLYLARHGLTKLMRLRVIGGNQVYEVGQGLVYNFAKPQELPPGYLDQICHMVEDGGAVGKTWVRHNLERAHLIGYVEEKGVIVAAGCLKHPRPEYVEMVREQTGLDLSGHVERGYTTVRPEYRGLGIGTELLAGETKRAGEKKVYSIISSDNLGAQKMALRNKTQKIATYFSPRLQKEISVWMPESMLP